MIPQTPGVPDHAAPDGRGFSVAQVRKLVVVIIAALLEAVNEGLLPDSWADKVTILIMIAAAVGVYEVPNAPGGKTAGEQPNA